MKFFRVVILAASIAAMSATAQQVTRVDGQVYLDGRLIESAGELPNVAENSVLRTEGGRAEVLLAPGATLRLAENASFRMITDRPNDTRIEVLTGSAAVLTDEAAKDTEVTVVCEDNVRLSNSGAYRFDVRPLGGTGQNYCGFRVYKGAALVQLTTVSVALTSGEMMNLNRGCGDHLPLYKFDVDPRASR